MAPRLDFSPALATSTSIPLTHSVARTIPIDLFVRLSQVSYENLAESKRQVQVWSDLTGKWRETPFELRDQTVEAIPTTTVTTISLLPAGQENTKNTADDGTVTLTASINVPNAPARYSFTFRLVGPGSNVEWLGTTGSNGTFVVGHRVGFEGTADAAEVDGQIEVGRFRNMDVHGWAFGFDSSKERIQINRSSPVTASIFILHSSLPAFSKSPHTDAPTSLLIESPSATLHPDGRLTVPSSQSAEVIFKQCTQESASNALQDAARYASNGLVVTMEQNTLSFIPVTSAKEPKTVPLCLEDIVSQAVTTSKDPCIAYAMAADAAYILEDGQVASDVAILVGPEGGELELAPSQLIGDGPWRIAAIGAKVDIKPRDVVTESSFDDGPNVTVRDTVLTESPVVTLPDSTMPTPPPSIPTHLNEAHMDQESQSTPSIADDPPLPTIPPATGAEVSLRAGALMAFFELWLQIFGLVALLLKLISANPRGYHKEAESASELTRQEVEGLCEGLEDPPHSLGDNASPGDSHSFKASNNTARRNSESTKSILTPPLTPPSSSSRVLPSMTQFHSVASGHKLHLSFTPGSTVMKVIAFRPLADSLTSDAIKIDGSDLQRQQQGGDGKWEIYSATLPDLKNSDSSSIDMLVTME